MSEEVPQSEPNVVGSQSKTHTERLIEPLDDPAVLRERNRMRPVAAKAKHRPSQLPVSIVPGNQAKWPATGPLVEEPVYVRKVHDHRFDASIAGGRYLEEVDQVHASLAERPQCQP